MATRYISSVINRDRYFVFMTATAENPVSRKELKSFLLFPITWDYRFSEPELRTYIRIEAVFQGIVTGYVYELHLSVSY
jgi:hypothetical protein